MEKNRKKLEEMKVRDLLVILGLELEDIIPLSSHMCEFCSMAGVKCRDLTMSCRDGIQQYLEEEAK